MNPKKAFGDKKPPLGQMPLAALIHGALAFYDGKGKYGNRNWRKNHVEAQTYVEAILRHVLLWANGEEHARDTGVHNLGGIIASASLLLDAQTNGCLIDNRVVSQANCDLLHEAEDDIARLNEQHKKRREELGLSDPNDDSSHMAVGEAKRAEAFKALQTYHDLVAQLERSPDMWRTLRPRITASRDVILNMVNGVFPEPVQVVHTSDFNPTVEPHVEGDMATPGRWLHARGDIIDGH